MQAELPPNLSFVREQIRKVDMAGQRPPSAIDVYQTEAMFSFLCVWTWNHVHRALVHPTRRVPEKLWPSFQRTTGSSDPKPKE